MKKLSLKNLKFETSEILRRNQLKTVLGGYGFGGDWFCSCKDGTNQSSSGCSSSECSSACSSNGGSTGACGCSGSGC